MCFQIRSILTFGIILGLAIALVSCGGEGPTGSRMPRSGRIYVRNDSDVHLWVRFVNEKMETIETFIDVGEKKLVSGDDPIQGGREVAVSVKGPISPGHDQTTEKEIKVPIDGNVTVIVTDIRSGQIDFQITAG